MTYTNVEQARVQFAVDILNGLKYQITINSLVSLVAWQTAEGGGFGNIAAFNPLNCTLEMPGSSGINDVGVQAYPDYETGLIATIRTLLNGDYPEILIQLQLGGIPQRTAVYVGMSPWGTNSAVMEQCIPNAEIAVSAYYQPGSNMLTVIKRSNGEYWYLVWGGTATYWRQLSSTIAANLPSGTIIPDPNDEFFNDWNHEEAKTA